MSAKRDYIRKELMVEGFMEDETNTCHLEENDDGESADWSLY